MYGGLLPLLLRRGLSLRLSLVGKIREVDDGENGRGNEKRVDAERAEPAPVS